MPDADQEADKEGRKKDSTEEKKGFFWEFNIVGGGPRKNEPTTRKRFPSKKRVSPRERGGRSCQKREEKTSSVIGC